MIIRITSRRFPTGHNILVVDQEEVVEISGISQPDPRDIISMKCRGVLGFYQRSIIRHLHNYVLFLSR